MVSGILQCHLETLYDVPDVTVKDLVADYPTGVHAEGVVLDTEDNLLRLKIVKCDLKHFQPNLT